MREPLNRHPLLEIFMTFLLVLLIDQFTKLWILGVLPIRGSIEVLPNIFNLTLVMNPGAAFGMFASLPDHLRRTALWTVSSIAMLVVFRLLIIDSRDDRLSQHALMAILAGAMGNMIDRIRYDAVVDFLDFYVNGHHWPAFNVADSAISIGVVLLLFRVFIPVPVRNKA